ncbi:MAG: Gfo/Idh/MocA family oxidoreductase [Alphaproteobacteria bacterium]|nr:Gfo/Idh/MocA family oxidoreductase [Alphaproteobacteria bacterium]
MSEVVGVGLIGAGIMGRGHAQAVSQDPRAKLVGVASLEGAEALAGRYGALATRDYSELLKRSDISMVIVATPDHAHYAICKAALEAGKHVLVEKPLTVDLGECDRLIETARTSRRKLMACFSHRWIPPYWAAHESVAAGKIGRPVLAYARKNDRIFVPTKMLSWAAGTTSAWFLSSHDIDLVTWYMGDKAVEVYATAVWGVLRARGIETPDAIQAQVRFAKGGVATFESCWIYPDTYPTVTDSFIEVVGETGVIHLERKHEQLEIASEQSYEWPRTLVKPMIAGRQQGALTEVIHHLIACVRDNREPLVTLESSREVTAILDAIHRSCASGKPEKVN